MAAVIGDLQVNLTAATAEFERKLKKARRGLDRFRKQGQALAAGGAALAGVSRIFIGVGRAAGDASRALSAGMANVATLIPANTARVSALKEQVQALSVAHGKQSQDLVGGLYQTISAFGDRAGQTMEILRINSEAATAGVATTEQALALTSAVTKAYGDTSAAAVRHAADLALTTVRLGQTDFPQLAAAIGKTTPLAAKLGVTQEELAASFATLTGVTGSTAEVSTQLRAVMAGLVKPSTAMRAALKALGVESGSALVESRGLVGALQALIETTDGSAEAVTKLTGRDEAFAAAMHLAGAGAQTFSSNLQEMESAAGATGRAFEVQTRGVNAAGHQWDQFLARVQRVKEDLGDALIPILLRAAEGLRPLVDGAVGMVAAFGRLPQSTQTAMVGLAGAVAVFSAVSLAVGGLMLSLSPLKGALFAATAAAWKFVMPLKATPAAATQAGAALRGVAPAAASATAGAKALGIAIRGLLLASGIGALVVGLTTVVPWFYRFWEASRDPAQRLAKLRDRLAQLRDRAAEVADRIARLEAEGKRVSPQLRRVQSRVEHQRRELERAVEATERLELAQSDLGKTLESLAARDMAAWSGAAEAARQRAAVVKPLMHSRGGKCSDARPGGARPARRGRTRDDPGPRPPCAPLRGSDAARRNAPASGRAPPAAPSPASCCAGARRGPGCAS